MRTLGLKRWMYAVLFGASGFAAIAQNDRLEVPGDHFSLEGALELFKKSQSPEEFERMLNSPDSKVNNLDLDGDGDIDYIRVIDRNEGNVHAFILQAVISANEAQDVAVIELEKLANGKAVLQITGDADIYGMETIIEPTEEVRVNAGTSTARTVVNVWAWPSVQYVYSPYYTVWVSPWSWGVRPAWWRPWRPVTYYAYSPWWEPYRPYYSACYTHRVVYAPHIYRPYRSTSVIVYNRHRNHIENYQTRSRRDMESDRYDRGGQGRYDYNRSNDRSNYTRSHADRPDGRSYDSHSGRQNETTRTPSRREWSSNSSRSESFGSFNRHEMRKEQPTQRHDNNGSRQFELRPSGRSESRSMQRSAPSQSRSSSQGTGSGNGGGHRRGRD